MASFSHGRYEVQEEIGRGGMGVVYRAHDQTLGRAVAVKSLSPALAQDPELHARFIREARALAQLRHPNVVAIHDCGDEDGTPWLAMDLCEEGSLADLIAKGPVPIATVRRVGVDVADALSAIHSAGLIHRDLKPENILRDGDRWLVSDFGIVRQQDGAATALTQTGLILGTPEYWPPEYLSDSPITPAADLYSLGCVLYTALVGRPPFHAENRLRVAMMHATEPAPTLPEHVAAADRSLAALTGSLMAKEPTMRPSVADTAAALRGTDGSASQPTMRTEAPAATSRPAPSDPAAAIRNEAGAAAQTPTVRADEEPTTHLATPTKDRRRPMLAGIASGVVVLVAAVGIGGYALLNGSDDTKTNTPKAQSATPAAMDADPAELPKGIIARVGDVDITLERAAAATDQTLAAYRAEGEVDPEIGTPEYSAVTKQAVQTLVQQQIIANEADECGAPCHVPEAKVVAELNSIIKTEFDGDRETYAAFLKERRMSRADARAIVRNSLLQQHLYDRMTRSVKVTGQEARSYYDTHPAEFVGRTYEQADAGILRKRLLKKQQATYSRWAERALQKWEKVTVYADGMEPDLGDEAAAGEG